MFSELYIDLHELYSNISRISVFLNCGLFFYCPNELIMYNSCRLKFMNVHADIIFICLNIMFITELYNENGYQIAT